MRLVLKKQRLNECALNALCVLTGTDYETASDLFQSLNGYSWGSSSDLRREDFAREFFKIASGRGIIWLDMNRSIHAEPPHPKPPYFLAISSSCGMFGHALSVLADGRIWDSGPGHLFENEFDVLMTYPGWCVAHRIKIGS